jgi:drug/metabolite transporter (DMT)-like permease
MSIATLFFLPFANIGELDFSLLGSSINLEGNLAAVNVPLWLALTFMGIFGSFLPMALTYLALRNLSATLVGVVATAETILAALFALLWLGEQISLTQFLGSIVVIAGILLAQTARESKNEKVVE